MFENIRKKPIFEIVGKKVLFRCLCCFNDVLRYIKFIEKEGDLVNVREVGGAFILLSRTMVKKMAKEYSHLSHPMYDGFPRLFEDEYTPNQWITEDYAFCERWRRIGGEVFVYPDIYFEHLGMYAVEGSYKKFLEDTSVTDKKTDLINIKEEVCDAA